MGSIDKLKAGETVKSLYSLLSIVSSEWSFRGGIFFSDVTTHRQAKMRPK